MAALQLVNLVRSSQFNEDMVAGSLHLLAQRLQQDPQALAEMAARFDAQIRILPAADTALDEYQHERLERGRPLIESANNGRTARLLYPMADDQLLDVQISTVTELQAQATAYLLVEDWQRSGESVESFLQRMQPRFGFPLSLTTFGQLLLSDADFARLQYGDVLVRIAIEGQEAEALVLLPGDPRGIKTGADPGL